LKTHGPPKPAALAQIHWRSNGSRLAILGYFATLILYSSIDSCGVFIELVVCNVKKGRYFNSGI
jgi:hypothetical protein